MVAIKLVFGLIILFFDSLPQWVASEQGNNLRTYIVHVKKPENGTSLQSEGNLRGWYESFLPLATASLHSQPRMLHTYRHVGSAFAARLTPEEAQDLDNKDGVLMVHEEKMLQLDTTHSPTFLGLRREEGLWRKSNLGKGVIIGVFDSGIWPSHPSFNDEGMPPPPARWKGKCHFGREGCNNKIIGAITTLRSNYLSEETVTPYDEEGHGTHTASTVAGNFATNANVLGHANGTAVGMAPHAHLAIYRVCNLVGCPESSVLAAFDIAIEDGVDIISVSLSGHSKLFFDDALAIGSFGAIQKGVLVSASAGNNGPELRTVTNEAPWLLTVGASTMDRRIVASAKLGNGAEFDGESLFQPEFKDGFNSSNSLFPLVYLDGKHCYKLARAEVKGKIVLCVTSALISRTGQAQAVKSAGGAAMILANSDTFGYTTLAHDRYPLPVTHVSHAAGLEITRYIDSTGEPEATILFKGTVTGDSSAPAVAYFSSRGPSKQSPGILKPDIVGPGVSVLAAWPDSLDDGDSINAEAPFNMMSGTSMSCPHMSGIAALLKSSHPDWSPAAIKSAMMTTAYATNREGKPIADERLLPASLFAIGAGHVNPLRANDPGLVYDMELNDYTGYLCGLGFTNKKVELITQKHLNCGQEKVIEATELNYPSFSALLWSSSNQTYTRTVTNVGPPDSHYTVKVVPPRDVGVSVEPQTLVFNGVQQKAKYSVTFTRMGGATSGSSTEGFLEWFSDKHSVRSPISVIFV